MNVIDNEDDIITFDTEEDVIILDEEDEGEGSDEYADDEENIFDESLINRRLEKRLRAYDEGDYEAIRRFKEAKVSAFVMWLKRSRTVGSFKFDILSMLTFSPTYFKESHKKLKVAKEKRREDSAHYKKFMSGIWEEVMSKWFLSVLVMFIVVFLVALKVIFSSISAMRHGGSKLWYVLLILIMAELAWNFFKSLRRAWVIAVESIEATIAAREVEIAKKTAEKKTEAKKKKKQQQINSASEQSTSGPIKPSRRGHNRWSGGSSTTTP